MPADALTVFATLVLYLIGIGVILLFANSARWAFRIRRALNTPLFKNRALWVGVVALFFVALVSSNLLIRFFAPNNFYLGLLEYCITNAAGIVTLAWIDATIKMARRSDPLNRNTLAWKQLRYVVWFFTLATTIGSLTSVVLFHADFFTWSGGAFVSGAFGWVLFGFIALWLSYRRSRDPMLREHLKWFGLFLFVLLIADALPSAQIVLLRIAEEILLAIDAYFLYRGTKSLAPLSKEPLEKKIDAASS